MIFFFKFTLLVNNIVYYVPTDRYNRVLAPITGGAENQREDDEGRHDDDHVPAIGRFAEFLPTCASKLVFGPKRYGLFRQRDRKAGFGSVIIFVVSS